MPRPEYGPRHGAPSRSGATGTANYDRGEKLEHYRRRASVQAVVLIDSREVRVTVVSRNPDATWTITDATSDTIRVPGIDVTFDLAELYAGVTFGAAAGVGS